MPNCTDCDAYIQSGARCQMCRVEHQHGTLTDGGRDTAGTLRTEIKCLACGNRAEELEEHHLHMARASHRDKGETWVRPSS